MYGDCLPYGSFLTWILEEPQFLLFLHLLTYFALASCLSFGGCPCCLFADSSSQFPVIRPPVKHDKWDRCLWPWKDLQKRAAGVSLQSAPCYCSVYVFINSDDQCEQKTAETTGVCHWKREDYQVFVQISPCYLFSHKQFLQVPHLIFIASICGYSFVEVQIGYSAVKKYLSLLWFLRFLDTVVFFLSHTYVSDNQTNCNIVLR